MKLVSTERGKQSPDKAQAFKSEHVSKTRQPILSRVGNGRECREMTLSENYELEGESGITASEWQEAGASPGKDSV